mgnify:FL=1
MSRLDEIMTNVGLPALRKQFGDDAIYTPTTGVPVSTWAMLSQALEQVGEYSPRAEMRRTAELPYADVPAPEIGATLTVHDVMYRIDQVLDSDGLTVKVAIA